MLRKLIGAILIPLLLTAGCGAQAAASEGLGADASATLQQVKTEIEALVSGKDASVGEVKAHFAKIGELLATARTQTKGLAQAVIANFQTVASGYADTLKSIPDAAPLSDLPADFTAIRDAVGKRAAELFDKLGLK